MSQVKVSGNASGTGIFEIAAPNSNTNRTLTLPDNTGTLISTGSTFAGNGPAFSAYQSAATTVLNNTNTKVAFNTEAFDTNSNYDTTNYRFLPTVAGYYLVTAVCRDGTGAGIGYIQTSISKTGTAIAYALVPSGGFGPSPSITTLVYMNGSTDYLEVYYYQNSGGTVVLNASSTSSYFQASLARSA